MNSSLVGGDPNNKFAVEPRRATGHTAVSLKVNSENLDYENANERKFLLLGLLHNFFTNVSWVMELLTCWVLKRKFFVNSQNTAFHLTTVDF